MPPLLNPPPSYWEGEGQSHLTGGHILGRHDTVVFDSDVVVHADELALLQIKSPAGADAALREDHAVVAGGRIERRPSLVCGERRRNLSSWRQGRCPGGQLPRKPRPPRHPLTASEMTLTTLAAGAEVGADGKRMDLRLSAPN